MVHLAEAVAVSDVHVSSILAVFLTPELNPVWNDRLMEQRLMTLDGRKVAFQVYDLPWPFADREFLLSCTDTEKGREALFHSACKSVVSDSLPVAEGRVRAHIYGAEWNFKALPDGSTHIRFKGSVDPMGPLPKWLISGAQKIISKQTIAGLLGAQKMLGLKPLDRFAHWGLAPDSPKLAAPGDACATHGRAGLVGWCRRTAWCPFVPQCTPPPPQMVAPAEPSSWQPTVLALLLCVGVALLGWLARRLSWQGLLHLVLWRQQRKRQWAAEASLPEGPSGGMRKVRSLSALRHDASDRLEPGELSALLSGEVAQQMRRIASDLN